MSHQAPGAPSPFPPIGDYAFLSDCHTAALLAPDGSVDWLCPARFDSPSVFGSLLDRGAGSFRLGPFGVSSPTARQYEPGSNVLVTTWKSPSGWIVVRDALTMGPRDTEDTVTPHSRPPTDDDADHMLVRTVTCLSGRVELELICDPKFDYGTEPATWTLVGDDRHLADAVSDGQRLRLCTDLALGVEGTAVRARHTLGPGEKVFCCLSWAEELKTAVDVADAEARLKTTVDFWRDWLDQARVPDHRWSEQLQRSALAIKGLTYMPTGATVAAPDHVAAGDARRRAQLGLPLHLDARHHVHPAGAALAEPRLGGRGVHAVRRRPRAQRRRLAADHVRDRRSSGPHRVDPRRPSWIRRSAVRCASATARSTSGRTTSSAPSSTRSSCTHMHSKRLPRRLWPVVAVTGGVRRARCGTSRTRASGRREASRSTTCPRSSCAGWHWTEPHGWPTSGARPTGPTSGPASRTRSGATSRSNGVSDGWRAAAALRHRRPGRIDAAGGAVRLPGRPTTRGCGARCSRSPTGSPTTASSCATGRTRPTTV